MQKNTLNRTKNTVSATYLPYAAYKSAIALATAHKGEIGKTAEGNFKATFNSVKTAEKFKSEWTAEYNAHRKADEPTPKSTPTPKSSTSKPTEAKGKKAPRKSKGNGVDFTQFKGTKSEKNRALHAMLVGMGHADSRTPEYQAVWSARPWAK